LTLESRSCYAHNTGAADEQNIAAEGDIDRIFKSW
jgi:hypothetical protein